MLPLKNLACKGEIILYLLCTIFGTDTERMFGIHFHVMQEAFY